MSVTGSAEQATMNFSQPSPGERVTGVRPDSVDKGLMNSSGVDHSRQPAYQTLADQLREQIVTGRLRPGERLPTEPQLCARSGLSRSTVREALRLLSSQQLIVTTRGVTGGSFVAEPDPERLGGSLVSAMRVLTVGMMISGEHFLELRELLEVPGAALAADRRTVEDLRALREQLLDPDNPSVNEKLFAYWRFRAVLATAVHNPLFELFASPLRQLANDRQLVAAGPADLWHQLAATDRLVASCVEDGDADGAARATRDHLRYLKDIYQKSEILLVN